MPTPIETAITDGLEQLVEQQNADGSWGNVEQNFIGTTALVLLRLEDSALALGYQTPFDDGYMYKSNVEHGLNYLLKNAKKDADNTIFFQDKDGRTGYETGMALAAICANADPNHAVGNVGNPAVDGKTYKEVADLIIAYLASVEYPNGGWPYKRPNLKNEEDCVMGYVSLGLEMANATKYKFNCSVPHSIRNCLGDPKERLEFFSTIKGLRLWNRNWSAPQY